jgi:two-component system invasion response regulator UvrY
MAAVETKKITVGLADDHLLLRTALVKMVNEFGNCRVVLDVGNGNDLIEKLKSGIKPDVLILDLNMPGMNGYDVAEQIVRDFPDVNILVLTMYDQEMALVRLLQVGIKGFLKKDIYPEELKKAIEAIAETGYYYSHDTTGRIINLFRKSGEKHLRFEESLLTETEIQFMKLSCTEKTYKEIAMEMNLNPRTIDNLRDNLFTRLNVKSRVGLAIFAVKNGLVIP